MQKGALSEISLPNDDATGKRGGADVLLCLADGVGVDVDGEDAGGGVALRGHQGDEACAGAYVEDVCWLVGLSAG